MTADAFNNELNRISAIINAMMLTDAQKATLQGQVTTLRGRIGELGTPTESTVITQLNNLKADVLRAFKLKDYTDFAYKYAYAMTADQMFNITRGAAAFELAAASDKFIQLVDFIGNFDTAINHLKANGIIRSDLKTDIGRMTKGQEKIFDKATHNAGDLLEKLDELQRDLEIAERNHDKREIKLLVHQIDRQLKKLNSTNRALTRLRKKVGQIGKHQRSITVKASEIRRERNQTIIDEQFNSIKFRELISNLSDAYHAQATARTATDAYNAKKAIKHAERELYGGRLTKHKAKKIDNAVAKRESIIRNAQAITSIEKKGNYKRQMRRTLNQLKKVDKKIIGKRNAEELYWGLKRKTGYLVGGTGLTLPTQVVELHASIAATRTR